MTYQRLWFLCRECEEDKWSTAVFAKNLVYRLRKKISFDTQVSLDNLTRVGYRQSYKASAIQEREGDHFHSFFTTFPLQTEEKYLTLGSSRQLHESDTANICHNTSCPKKTEKRNDNSLFDQRSRV